MALRIASIEDDPACTRVLSRFLSSKGFIYAAIPVATWSASLLGFSPDLLLLDWVLPENSGLEILSKVRSVSGLSDLPIILLSGLDSVERKVAGISAGADDYITKPFHTSELLARMNAVLRRYKSHLQTYEDSRIKVDILRRRLLVNNAEIMLSPQEWTVLIHLLKSERPVERQELHSCLSGSSISQRQVDVIISTLRHAIEPETSSPTYITTVRGVGYQFQRAVPFQSDQIQYPI